MSHKALQLCAQVRRSLELTLMGECSDELLQNMIVAEVEPAPDDKHLRATFEVMDPEESLDKVEVMARLEAARPLMMAGVARAISRRKIPEIHFEVIRAVH